MAAELNRKTTVRLIVKTETGRESPLRNQARHEQFITREEMEFAAQGRVKEVG